MMTNFLENVRDLLDHMKIAGNPLMEVELLDTVQGLPK